MDTGYGPVNSCRISWSGVTQTKRRDKNQLTRDTKLVIVWINVRASGHEGRVTPKVEAATEIVNKPPINAEKSERSLSRRNPVTLRGALPLDTNDFGECPCS